MPVTDWAKPKDGEKEGKGFFHILNHTCILIYYLLFTEQVDNKTPIRCFVPLHVKHVLSCKL
jgi:hypothetical protein